MSTSPTVLPIDAPPPIPTVSPYPMGIASFYYPGYSIETASSTFDVTKPAKFWSRPLQPGENPNSLFGPVGYFQGVNYIAGELFMTRGQAAATNIVPADQAATEAQKEALAGTVYGSQTVPIPARPPLATESIVQVVGMVVITNSAVAGPAVPQSPAEMADSAKLDAILSIVKTIPGVVVPAGE